MYLLERDVMTAAYSVRKLVEARKVSDTLSRKSWAASRFERIGPVPDVWNSADPERLFDMSSPAKCSLSTLEVCNQIIHSYLFFPMWRWNEETYRRIELDALAFVSDRRRREYLYSMKVETLVALLTQVGDEDVVSVTIRSDKAGLRQIAEVVGVNRDDPRHRANLETNREHIE